jgi:preprotein translocase subunit YajC
MRPDPTVLPADAAGWTVPCTATATWTQEPKVQPDQPSPTQEPGPAAPGGTTGTGTGTGQPAGPLGPMDQVCGSPFAMIGLFLVIMWLLVLRPESRRRKETQAMLGALKQGDRVVTIGGMHGVVASIADKTVKVRVDTLTMDFDRSAIARVVRDEPPREAARKP